MNPTIPLASSYPALEESLHSKTQSQTSVPQSSASNCENPEPWLNAMMLCSRRALISVRSRRAMLASRRTLIGSDAVVSFRLGLGTSIIYV